MMPVSTPRPRRSTRPIVARLLIAVFAALAVLFGSVGSASAADPAPVQVITGVSGSLSELAISADGAWRVAVEKNASAQKVAVWRSSNATSWTRIALPAGVTAGAVGILTNGNVILARGNGTNAVLYKYTTSWSTATTIGSLTTGEVAALAIASGTTPTIVAVATQGSVFSSISGGTWATSTLTGVGTIGSVGLIGATYVHIIGSGGYVRWSTSTRAQVGSVNATITSGQVMSAPSSTTTVYAVAGGSGGFTVRKSTDSGATWTVLASGVSVPYRAGVTFGSPRMLSDGSITIYGSALESGTVSVYSSGWAPATATWGTVRRSATTLTSGTLAIWPTQLVSGTQPVSAERWVTQSTGAPATTSAWFLGGTGDPAGWATTSQTVSGSTVLTGVSGSLSSPVRSPSGTWRALLENDGWWNPTWVAAVWRSSDGVTWQRIPLPQVEPSVVVGISNTGAVSMVDTNGVSRSWQFAGTEWIGPVALTVSGSSTPMAVVSDGTTLVVPSVNGTLNYSTDAGASWSSGQSVGLSSITSARVVGSYLHLSGSGGYRRWSFATKAAVDAVVPGLVNATVVSAPASTTNLWAVAVGSTMSVWKSIDSGTTWSSTTTAELLPYRTAVAFGSPVIAADGKIHLFGATVESGTVAVYEAMFDPVSKVWSTMQRAPTTVPSGVLLIWPTQKVDGTQTSIARWVVRSVGSPATYTVTDASTGNVTNPWATTSQTAVGQTMLTGVTGALDAAVFSPSGTWRTVLEHGDASNPTLWAAVWRSSDGLTWQRIPFPATLYTVAVTVSDTGVVGVADQNGTTRYQAFTGSDWFGGITVPETSTLTGLVSDGSTLLMTSANGTLNYSSDAGASWSAAQTTGLSSISSVTAIGGYAHLSGSAGYRHWSFSTKAVTDSVVSAVVNATVLSAPGSTSNLWAIRVAGGALTVWHTTDSGVSWTTETASEGLPYRSGATFGSAVIGSDAKIHLFGSTIEAGTLAGYELIWDPVGKVWSTVQRGSTTLTSGALVVWPTQRLNGSQGSVVRWALSGVAPRTALNVTAGYVASPWSTSQLSTAATVLSGVVGALDYPSMSPNGVWRMVEEHLTNTSLMAAVWRSSDGISWQRVPLPELIEQPGPIAIGDDGTILVVRSLAAGTVLESAITSSWLFDGGEWRGPRPVDASGQWNELARVLRSNGNTWMVLTDFARVLYSTDGAKTWSGGGNIGAGGSSGTATTVDVIGDVAHAFGGTQYSRWSFTTHAPLTFPTAGSPVVKIGYVSGGKILATPGSTSDVWMAWGGSALTLQHSTDGGATWSTLTTPEALPRGMTSNTFEVAQDGKIHFYSVASCSAARLVYSASHPLAEAPGWSDTIPMAVDESSTATLIDTTHGALVPPTASIDAWFDSGTSPAFDLLRSSGVIASPESVFGSDGYGMSVDGVSAAIGAFSESHTDVAITGVGPQLGVTRTYNSADRRVGLFGRGWTSSLEMRAFENCVTHDVTILYGDGRRETHYWDGVSAYITPPGYTTKLTKNGSTGWTLNEVDGTVASFRTDGRLTSIADADGQSLTFTWNGSNQLTTVTDAVSGRYLTLTYSAGLVTSISTQPVTVNGATAPLTWNYAYSGNDLSKVCEPRDNNVSTGYCITYTSVSNRIETITDANGHVDRKIGYNGAKVAWEENGTGNRTTFSYPTSLKTIVTDPNLHSVTNEFDGSYRTVKVTDQLGGVTLYGYDTNGFRNSTTDQNNHTTTQVLDIHGNVLSETNPLTQTAYFAYDAYSNKTQIRDARSANASDNTYLVTDLWNGPARQKLSESTPPTSQQPTGTTKVWSYSNGTEPAVGGGLTPVGLLLVETDARGATTTYQYDSVGNVRRVTDRLGLVTEFTYDQIGRKISQTQYPTGFAAGVTTTFDLDAIGNTVVETDPAVTNTVTGLVHRRRQTNTYDPAGRLSQSVESDIGGSAGPDPSRTTLYGYDNADRPTSITDPENGVATNIYDPAGNLVETIDPLGRHRITAFDARNLPISVTARSAVKDEGASTFRDVVLHQATYDPAGRQLTDTDAEGVVTEIAYDNANRTTSRTVKNYHTTSGTTRDIVIEATTYDPAGHPLTITTGGGLRTEQFVHDQAGMLVAWTLDPAGLNRTTTIGYDKNGNATSKALSDALRTEETRATFDAGDNLLSSTVENGAIDLVTTHTYDNRGIAISTVEPRGNELGGTAANYRVDYTLDALGRTTQIQSPPVTVVDNGLTTTGVRPAIATGYDTYGNATQLRDERQNITTYGFDRINRNTLITYPGYTNSTGVTLTPTEVFAYDPAGNMTSHTDRRGQATLFAFDGLNRMVTQTDPTVGLNPAGVVSVYYDDNGHTVTTIDQRGARNEATFDDLGRQRTSTSVVRNGTGTPDRFTTSYDYDDLGNYASLTMPGGSTYTALHNAAREPTQTTDPLGFHTTYTFDVGGRISQIVDPLGRRVNRDYDLAGRPTATRRYNSSGVLLTTTTATFDTAGNQTGTTTPRGYDSGANPAAFTTSYNYDALSRLTTVSQPTSGVSSIITSYAYDAAGNQTVLTDGRGNATAYRYNSWNLPTDTIEPITAAHPSAADRTWTIDYDAGGLPVKTTEPGAVIVNRSFDELGRMSNETGSGPNAATATRTFGYDATGLTTTAGSPAGTIGLNYDDRGLLTATTGPTQFQSNFIYDSNGRMKERTDGAGTTTFTWTTRDELATATNPLTSSTETYGYDAAGQLATVTYGTGAARTLGYDQLGRLTSDELRNSSAAITASYTYGYDSNDNIIAKTINLPGNSATGANTYTYDNADRLTSWTKPDTTTANYVWDNAGNLVSNAGTTTSFDERNRILAAAGTTYTWSPRGSLQQTANPADPQPKNYSYDGLDRSTVADANTYTYDSLDRITTASGVGFSYAGTEIDPVVADQLKIARTPAGNPLATQQAALPGTLVGQDRHGDIGYQQQTDGTVTATRIYDPLGTILNQTGATTALGYQGDYTSAAGDVWMGARWYRPGTSTFLNRDTYSGQLSAPISLNRYTYASANPIGRWDPDGHKDPDVATPTSVCTADVSSMSTDDFENWVEAYASGGGQTGCEAAKAATVVSDVKNFVVTTTVQALASLACGSVAAVATDGNPVAIGAAANACGGAAGRATSVLLNGGSALDALSAAGDPMQFGTDTLVGGISGWVTSAMSPTWASPAQRAIGEGTANVVSGAAGAFAQVITQGGTIGEAVSAATDLQAGWGRLVSGAASSLIGGSPKPGTKERTSEATESVRPPSSPNYSVAYEAQLPEGAFPGRSAEYHFSEANRQLHGAFESDPAFAASMEAQYPGIVDGVSPGPRGGFPRESPSDALTWHHEATTPGTMQLVPYEQHVAPGPIQGSLHPGGKGGMAIWGGGR